MTIYTHYTQLYINHTLFIFYSQSKTLSLSCLLSLLVIISHSKGESMGFPVGYSELLLPRIFLHLLSFLGLIRKLISTIFWLIGLPDFLEPEPVSSSWPEPPPTSNHQDPHLFSAALLAGDILPVVRFSDLNRPESECCAVCLYDFENDDEIRRLTNCRHIFHKGCLDRWMMDYNQMTCPLCRTQFIPDDLQVAFNHKLWSESSEVSELLVESF
ncbi:brassinosteroid-responsive RING protein 1 [Raphanus sativus]|uniref:Brassinosteroid-responsive RING protein 1 n=1 Tax=Raphanus sativus TaxID=3726 RepID=A0A6J0L656_RAPSA|nr:brassinosteroid-responsive RING protein 1 [Raphanus sativus]